MELLQPLGQLGTGERNQDHGIHQKTAQVYGNIRALTLWLYNNRII